MKLYLLFATVVLVGLKLSPVYAQEEEEDRFDMIVPPKVIFTAEEDLRKFDLNDKISVSEVITQTGHVRQMRLKKGAKTLNHNHPEEETVVIINGRLKAVTIDGEHILEAGDAITMQSYAEHHLEALEDTYMVGVFGYGRVFFRPDM